MYCVIGGTDKDTRTGENAIGLPLGYRADAKRKFVSIVRSYRMSVSKFGSLTISNGRLISLTPEGLKMTRNFIYTDRVFVR